MAERSKALQLSVVDWRGVGSNPAGDIYFHFEFFAPSPFRTGQRSRCKWNQACPFTWSHSCFRPQIWFIIQGFVYKYLQYSFKGHWWGFNARNVHMVHIGNSILKEVSFSFYNFNILIFQLHCYCHCWWTKCTNGTIPGLRMNRSVLRSSKCSLLKSIT